ncbi:MAG: hypothetical protein ACREGA_00425 [Candidatus Saccharimonadales bacterium]
MEKQSSPFLLASQLQTQFNGILSGIDVLSLPVKEAKLINGLRREMADARLDIRDYEMSENKDEQLENARTARKMLGSLRANILALSEYNVFSAVDVAQISAQIEQIIDELK